MYAGRLKGYRAIGYRIGGADAENEPDTSLSPKRGLTLTLWRESLGTAA
jgi:hypothetical protein